MLGARAHPCYPRCAGQVQDLHDVTPATMVELGGGSVHELSYQQARNNRTATGQVYVAEPGATRVGGVGWGGTDGCGARCVLTVGCGWPCMQCCAAGQCVPPQEGHPPTYLQSVAFHLQPPTPRSLLPPAGYLLGKAAVPKHAIITAVAGQPTANLDQFVAAIKVRVHGYGVNEWVGGWARGESSELSEVCKGLALGGALGGALHMLAAVRGAQLTSAQPRRCPRSPSRAQGLAHGQRVPLEYYTFSDRNRRKNVILHSDWNWLVVLGSLCLGVSCLCGCVCQFVCVGM